MLISVEFFFFVVIQRKIIVQYFGFLMVSLSFIEMYKNWNSFLIPVKFDFTKSYVYI